MVEAVDAKSILLEKIQADILPLQDETSIIMNLFRRSRYVNKSIFVKLETLRNQSLVQIRQELNKIKSGLDEQSSSQSNLLREAENTAKKLVDDMLQVEQIDHLIETWDQRREGLKILTMDSQQYTIPQEKITESTEKYMREHELRVNHSIKAIQNLRKDILLVQSVATDKWNHAILEDVFRFIQFFSRIFPRLSERSKFRQGPIGALQKHLESLERLWAMLREKHKDFIDVSQLEDRGKIPAKSIRELYIFNEVSRKVFKGRLILVMEPDMQEKAKEIRKIFKTPNAISRN